ncbi:ABC transporter, partial [Streptomyces sp. SID6041]|nr:ABC transporter [Streptomyces sp. SID6041]
GARTATAVPPWLACGGAVLLAAGCAAVSRAATARLE